MKKMHFMIGAMGSGKSTVIRHLFVDAPYVHSLDELRLQAFRAAAAPAAAAIAEDPKLEYRTAWEWCNTYGKSKFQAAIQASLNNIIDNRYQNVVIDEMNLTPKSRAGMLQFAREHGYTAVAHEFIVGWELLQARQSTRTDKFIPLDAVRDAYFRLVPPKFGIGGEFAEGHVHFTHG